MKDEATVGKIIIEKTNTIYSKALLVLSSRFVIRMVK